MAAKTKPAEEPAVEAEQTAEQSGGEARQPKQYDNSKWSKPNERAKSYAAERKKKIHHYGEKKGKPLTEYEAGLRSGYLQSQHDHAGFWKYKKALELGYSKAEAAEMSKNPWNKNTPPKEKKKRKKGDDSDGEAA